jgi:hypothetical protein
MRLRCNIIRTDNLNDGTSCFQETVSFDSVPDPRLQLASVIRINGKDVFLDSRLDMIRFPVSPDSLNNFSAFTVLMKIQRYGLGHRIKK